MAMEMFVDVLEAFKANEKPEGVLIVADNQDLIKIVVAWTNTDVRQVKKMSKPPEDSEVGRWDWMWKYTRFSQQELIRKGAQPSYGFEGRLASLIGNRILYPDGTINSFVERYLRERVLKLYDAKPKKPRKKAS